MKKFDNYGAMPTDYEDELLTIMMEELSEIAIRASKMKRFGIDETQPGQPFDNRERLSQEIGDLMAVLQLCKESKLVDDTVVTDQLKIKNAKLKQFMRY